jgi:hypothetical protein
MIERSFTLQTDLFEGVTPGAHFINERCFGEDFAALLKERLERRGLKPSPPIQEDWGWAVLVPFQGHKFTLSVGIIDESIGKCPSEWRVGIAFEKPLNRVGSWFRAAPSGELIQLAKVVEEMLRAEPRVQQIPELDE